MCSKLYVKIDQFTFNGGDNKARKESDFWTLHIWKANLDDQILELKHS